MSNAVMKKQFYFTLIWVDLF